MKLQLFTYRLDGVEYCEGIEAKDEADMIKRIQAMAKTAVYDGEFVAEIDADIIDEQWARDVPDLLN